MRTIKTLAITLSLSSALLACSKDLEPSQPQVPDQDQGQADMAPDANPRRTPDAGDMPGLVRLLGLTTQDPRSLVAAAPGELTLEVSFEGIALEAATLSYIFGQERVDQQTELTSRLQVSPPARESYRGLVEVELSYKDQRISLAGGLRYGASLSESVPADAPQVEPLEGLTQADQVWPMGEDRVLVMQRGRAAGGPAKLTQAQETLALYERDANGALKLVATRACCTEVIVVVNEIPVRTPLAPPDSPTPGQLQLIPMRVNQDKIEDGEPLLTLPLGAQLLSLEAYQGQLYALALLDDARGGERLGLFDVQSGKLYQHPTFDKLEARSARLVSAKDSADGPAISGLSSTANGAQVQVIFKAATDGAQQAVTLETLAGVEPKSASLGVVLALNNTKKDAPKGLIYQITSAKLTRLEGGTLEPPAIPGGAPSYKRQLGPFEQDGIDHTTFNSILKGTLSAITSPAGGVSTVASVVLAAGDEPCPMQATSCVLPQTWLLTLPLDGDLTAAEAIPLLSPSLVQAGSLLTPHITRVERRRDKTVLISMILDAKEVTFSYDPSSELSIKDGVIIPGAEPLASALSLKGPGDAPATTVILKRSSPKFSKASGGAITGPYRGFGESSEFEIDNNKVATTITPLPLADGSVIERISAMTTAQSSDGGDDLILEVTLVEREGARIPALWRISAETLQGVTASDSRLTPREGIVRLPAGFVVRSLVAHEDEIFILGAQSADKLYGRDGRFQGSLFGTSVSTSGAGQVVLRELLTSEQVSQGAKLTLASLVRLGPDHSALLLRDELNQREAARLYLLKPKEEPKLLELPQAPLAGVTYWGAAQREDGTSALILGYDDAATPMLVSVDLTTGELKASPALTGVAPELSAQLASEAQLAGPHALLDPSQRSISADVNGDGLEDLLVSTALPLGEPLTPAQLVQGYHYVLLGQPDGTYWPSALPASLGYDVQQVSALGGHPRLRARLRRKP